MVRSARSKTKFRGISAQLAISACVLLLPPIAVGAAVFAMLPARDDGGARDAAQGTTPVVADMSVSKTVSQAPPGEAFALASATQAPVAKDPARAGGPVPVHVTVVVAP